MTNAMVALREVLEVQPARNRWRHADSFTNTQQQRVAQPAPTPRPSCRRSRHKRAPARAQRQRARTGRGAPTHTGEQPFTGKELDPHTNLYYFGARYYDPKQTQWMSADPALGWHMMGQRENNGGVYLPLHLGLYSYTINNPIRYLDATGREEGDTADVLISFIPLVGPTRDAVRDAKRGHWGWFAVDAAFVVLDVVTLGEAEVERVPLTAVKEGVREGAVRATARTGAEVAPKALEKGALAEKKIAQAAKPIEEAKASREATAAGAKAAAEESGEVIRLPQSVGAAARDIFVRGGGKLVGGKITNVERIAQGHGIRDVNKLVERFGGKAANWRKMKGVAMIETPSGVIRPAEVHWYEGHGVGRVLLRENDG